MTTQSFLELPEAIQAEAIRLFTRLASEQRGKPEFMGTSMSANPGLFHASGLYTWSAEHIGDLTHRMSEMAKYRNFGIENVGEKVNKAYRYLRNAYGFEREIKENLRNNFDYRTRENGLTMSFQQFEQEFVKAAGRYAEAHAALTVWNEAQWHGREAAVALGLLKYDAVEWHITALKAHLNDGWNDWASQVTVRGRTIVPYRGKRVSESSMRRLIDLID